MTRKWVTLLLAFFAIATAPMAFAQDDADTGEAAIENVEDSNNLKGLVAIGVGLVVIGTGLGIGRLAAAALEGMARQPEAAGKLQVNMLIAAALIEGVALFGAVICIMAL